MAQTAKRLVLPPALGSYAFLFKAREPMKAGDKPKFSLVLIWPKTERAKLKELETAIVEVAKSKWGEEAPALLAKGKLKNPLRDGDEDRPDDRVFKDALFVTASGERQPGVVDAQVQPVFEESEAYSGCTFRASVALFAFDKGGNRGVAVGLNNVQVVKKGPRLDGRKSAEEDFAKYADASGAEGLL